MNNNIKTLENILLTPDVEKSIKDNETIIFEIIPILEFEKDFEQRSKWHSYDVWNHTIKAISSSEMDFEVRLVLLLHDIGKPFSYQDDGNIRHFKGHALKSREIAMPILEKLGYSGEKLEELLFLIGEHATTIDMDNVNNENIDLYSKLLNIQFCDASAYELTHSKVIIANLTEIKEKLKKQSKTFKKESETND